MWIKYEYESNSIKETQIALICKLKKTVTLSIIIPCFVSLELIRSSTLTLTLTFSLSFPTSTSMDSVKFVQQINKFQALCCTWNSTFDPKRNQQNCTTSAFSYVSFKISAGKSYFNISRIMRWNLYLNLTIVLVVMFHIE